MDDETFDLTCDHIKEINEICKSDNLSLTTLQEKINEGDIKNINRVLYIELPENLDEAYPLLHTACKNKNVTLEIVKYLMDTFPEPQGEWSTSNFCPNNETEAYPIHCACSNKDCPNDVIRFLVEQDPEALKHLCIVDEGIHNHNEFYIEGLPLHYYLARNLNIDIDIVKMLVERYPQSLMTSDENWPCYPIHVVVSDKHCINQELLMYLLEQEPASIRVLDGNGYAALHHACYNKHLTLGIFQIIFNKWPEAIRMRTDSGYLPIHELCTNENLDDNVSLEVLQYMISIDPMLVREVDEDLNLPIHYAVYRMSTAFCKVLVDAYPDSLKVEANFRLPIHDACGYGGRVDTVDTVQYMLDLYPASINAPDNEGWLPIHHAAQARRADFVELLLKLDLDAASKNTNQRQLPLHLAISAGYLCVGGQIIRGINSRSKTVQVLYDAYPEAINIRDGDGLNPLDVARRKGRNKVVNFLQTQLVYAQQAQDATAMTTPDENGWLPLHRALLQGDASLGSIKLLVRGNLSALRVADQEGVLPLHIACRNATADIVQFLVDSYDGLDVCDTNKDSILHYACRGGNLGVIRYLLDNHTSLVASAEMNERGELPIHLLCEAGKVKVDNDDSTEYIEIIWRMLLANPEAVAGV